MLRLGHDAVFKGGFCFFFCFMVTYAAFQPEPFKAEQANSDLRVCWLKKKKKIPSKTLKQRNANSSLNSSMKNDIVAF